MQDDVTEQPEPRTTNLPTGTVTLLFSDIEGSTVRWDRGSNAMQDAVRRHDAIMRTVIEANQGRVFKTIGDAFCAAFGTAREAVIAALDAQRALTQEDFSEVDGLRVRVAIHTGETDERDGDFFGTAVNQVARLLAIGHGGQVLISSISRDLAESALPPDISFFSLGEHRLKDLAKPQHVYQLHAPDLPQDFPTLNSLDAIPNNLPLQPTNLIGRDEEIREIVALLEQNRLVTLVGSGGIGKTRAALQVATNFLSDSGIGVWFIDLAPLSDASLVVPTVAKTLGLQQSVNQPVLEMLLGYLKRQHLLLVFDNCEHVLPEAARLADAIQRSCPTVSILATSRQGLGVGGEVTYRLPSLSVPSDDVFLTLTNAMDYSAVALFVSRARLADPRFLLTDESAPVVVSICKRLDGIPLALELAAARVKVLTIPDIDRRLDQRFHVLTGGSRATLPRQQTMRALIDWSYDLLNEAERILFRRQGIFAGGWTAEAAERVCSGEGLDELDIIDALTLLVEKSLVVADLTETTTRFHLLESSRAYAIEKLEEAKEHELLAKRHADWIVLFAEDVVATVETTPVHLLEARINIELQNIRDAINWGLGPSGEVTVAGRIMGRLGRMLVNAGFVVDVQRWAKIAFERLDSIANPSIAGGLWRALVPVAAGREWLEAADHALYFYELAGDEYGAVRSQHDRAEGLSQLGQQEEARSTLEVVLTWFRSHGKTHTLSYAAALTDLGYIIKATEVEAARKLFDDALAISTSYDDKVFGAMIRMELSDCAFIAGDTLQAVVLLEQARPVFREQHNVLLESISCIRMAAYYLTLDLVDEAGVMGRDALRMMIALNHTSVYFAIERLSAVAALRGESSRAAILLGYVNECYRRSEFAREADDSATYRVLLESLKANLTEDQIATFAVQGARLNEEAAVDLALQETGVTA